MTNVDVSNYTNIKNNNKGTVALVLGIISIVTSFIGIGFILGIIGLIYGVIGLKQNKQNGKRKTLTGIVCCLLGIFFTMLSSITAGIALFS